MTGAAEWHVNADEPVLLDYNLDFEDAAFFDADNPFRASDHDPILVGLDLTPAADDEPFAALPDLKNRDAVASERVNGIDPQDLLNGDVSDSFEISLFKLPGTSAGFRNTLGVYEVDENGNIVDVQLLFENTRQIGGPNGVAVVDEVDAGNELGFFLVQNGFSWARSLAEDAEFSFVNSDGLAANVADGSSIALAVNVIDSGRTVFHSYDAALNIDEFEHVLSAFDRDTGVLSIGFEDLVGGGDRDYEDVLFTVTPVFDMV
jgi:hypothetical protein